MGSGVYKRGQSYYVDFWVRGRRYTECLGRVSKTFAKEEAARRKTALIEGRLRPKAQDPGFSRFIDTYLAEVSINKAEKSHARDRTSAVHLKAFFGGKRVSQISRMDVERYKRERRQEIEAKGRTGLASVNRELALLSHAFNVAKLPNPVRGVKRFPEFGRERFLTEDEESRMFEALAEVEPDLEPLFRVLINAGYRVGEVLALRNDPEMVNFRAGWIRIPRMVRKGKKRDVVTPLNDVLTESLKRAIRNGKVAKGEVIFPYTVWHLDRVWQKVRRLAGLGEDVRIHDLRHTFGSRAGSQAHDDPYAVQELMGHSDFRTTQKYIHVDMARKRAIMKRLEKVPTISPTVKVLNRR
ncbi:MAG: tyrosine-type recombinase/integrase [Deltaproteobacteria bacterium]|nr:tyrosine-type recombinase/integrase [Deltaproteobacteria bacterium]